MKNFSNVSFEITLKSCLVKEDSRASLLKKTIDKVYEKKNDFCSKLENVPFALRVRSVGKKTKYTQHRKQ